MVAAIMIKKELDQALAKIKELEEKTKGVEGILKNKIYVYNYSSKIKAIRKIIK